MNFAHQYVRSAEVICTSYDAAMPLAAFLKQYFSQHKKYGSKDRKRIADACYIYYRLGKALDQLSFEERLRVALFLCHNEPGEWQVLFDEVWINRWDPSLAIRLQFIAEKYPLFSLYDIFSWQDKLSEGYDAETFAVSHLIQPDLFLRLRPGHTETVFEKLDAAQIPYTSLTRTCIAIPNKTKIDEVVAVDKQVVVQDYSSQRVSELLDNIQDDVTDVWDCCAASGGKSLLVYDTIPGITLTVSDVRESIIRNLEKRFSRAGIRPARIAVIDLSKPVDKRLLSSFDLIICDAPCTGSGTWGRTPEQLYFFQTEKIVTYASLQKKILANIIPHLKKGGYILYSTCSVFLEENEQVVEHVLATTDLQLIEKQSLQGYTKKADSMFAALLQKK